jgi:hypothetical protein
LKKLEGDSEQLQELLLTNKDGFHKSFCSGVFLQSSSLRPQKKPLKSMLWVSESTGEQPNL